MHTLIPCCYAGKGFAGYQSEESNDIRFGYHPVSSQPCLEEGSLLAQWCKYIVTRMPPLTGGCDIICAIVLRFAAHL